MKPSASPPARQHNPQPQPEGTIKCCGRVYARHAHAAHLRGEAIHEWASGIGVVAADHAPSISGEMARARLYAAQAQRDRPQRVDGAEDSTYGW